MSSYMDDDRSDTDDELLCPLCMDELDVGDRNFRPCQCGYQMCRFCWHEVKENLNGKCPACRQPYSEENYSFTPPNPEEIAQQLARKKEKEKRKKKEDKVSRKNLANVRVIQRNLVYITNLALSYAKEEILRKPEYFGQYGKIQKVVVNKNNLYNINSPGGPSVSAYVTYYRPQDAMAAIKAVDGTWLGGRTLRASFGTTKYCTYFLKHIPCTNPDCMYLHELGDETSSFTKEEMATGKSSFHNKIHPLTDDRGSAKGGMPPPPGLDMEEAEEVPPNGHVVVLGVPLKTPPNAGSQPSPSGDSEGTSSKESNEADSKEKEPLSSSGAGLKQSKPAWNKITPAASTPAVRINCTEWPTPNATPAPPPPPVKPKPNPLSRSEDRAAPVSQSVLPPTASWASKANTAGNATNKLKQSAPVLMTKEAKKEPPAPKPTGDDSEPLPSEPAVSDAAKEREDKKVEKDSKAATKQKEAKASAEQKEAAKNNKASSSLPEVKVDEAQPVQADVLSPRREKEAAKAKEGAASSTKKAAQKADTDVDKSESITIEEPATQEPTVEQTPTKQESKQPTKEKSKKKKKKEQSKEKEEKKENKQQGKGKKNKDGDGEEPGSGATLSASGKKARTVSPRKNKKDNKFVIIEPTYAAPTPSEKDEADAKRKEANKKGNKQKNASTLASGIQSGSANAGLSVSSSASSTRTTGAAALGQMSLSTSGLPTKSPSLSTSPPPGFDAPPGLNSPAPPGLVRPSSPPSVWDELVEEGDEELVRSVLPGGHHHPSVSVTEPKTETPAPTENAQKENSSESEAKSAWDDVRTTPDGKALKENVIDDDEEEEYEEGEDAYDPWAELGLEDIISQSNISLDEGLDDDEEETAGGVSKTDAADIRTASKADGAAAWSALSSTSINRDRASSKLNTPPGFDNFGSAWGARSNDETNTKPTVAGSMERSRSRFGFVMEESEEDTQPAGLNSVLEELEPVKPTSQAIDRSSAATRLEVDMEESVTVVNQGLLAGPGTSASVNGNAGLLATPPGNITMVDYMRHQQMAMGLPGGLLYKDAQYAGLPLGYGGPPMAAQMAQSAAHLVRPQQHLQTPSQAQQQQQQPRQDHPGDSVRDAFRALFPPSVNISFAPAGPQSSQPPAPTLPPTLPSHLPFRDQGVWGPAPSMGAFGPKQTMSPIFNPSSPWGPPTMPPAQQPFGLAQPTAKSGVWGSPSQPSHPPSMTQEQFTQQQQQQAIQQQQQQALSKQRKGQQPQPNAGLPLKEPTPAKSSVTSYATTAAQAKKPASPQPSSQPQPQQPQPQQSAAMAKNVPRKPGQPSSPQPGAIMNGPQPTHVPGSGGPFHDPAIMGQGMAFDMRSVTENAWGGAYARAFPMAPPGMQMQMGPGPALAAMPARGGPAISNGMPPLVAPPGFNFATAASQHQALLQHQYHQQQAALFQNGNGSLEHHKRAAEHQHHLQQQHLQQQQQQAEQARRSSAQSGRHQRPVKS